MAENFSNPLISTAILGINEGIENWNDQPFLYYISRIRIFDGKSAPTEKGIRTIVRPIL